MSYTHPELLAYLDRLVKFHIDGPRLGNTYLEDTAMQKYTQKYIGDNHLFKQELIRLGDRFCSEYIVASRNAEMFHPILEQFDSYGKRIDKLHLSDGWKNHSKYSAEDGIVALSYEKDQFLLGEHQRLGQLIVLTMYHPSSGLYGCPLAMTDGAAYVIKNLLEKSPSPSQELSNAFSRLTSRDPSYKWTSGQWMTEKKGGSDVSQTETIAIKEKDGYRLYGYKWFSSATDSNIALTLAKVIPEDTKPTPAEISKLPLSMFMAKIRGDDGELNNIEIVRLKDKLGTRQLPTAELLLRGTAATLVGEEKKGVKEISYMLTVTRLYNAATAVGIMRRMVALARDYSFRRTTGRTPLHTLPLHVSVLADMQITYRGNLIFYLRTSELFSKEQAKTIKPNQSGLLRMIVPVLKLFTGKEGVRICSEGLECFGGMGYIEGTMLPALARDAQVLTIWQGTTSVLSHDLARSLLTSKSENPLQSFSSEIMKISERFMASESRVSDIDMYQSKVIVAYNSLLGDLSLALSKKFKGWENELRSFAFGVARVYISFLLLNEMLLNPDQFNITTYKRWVTMNSPLYALRKSTEDEDRKVGLDLNIEGKSVSGLERDSRDRIRPRF